MAELNAHIRNAVYDQLHNLGYTIGDNIAVGKKSGNGTPTNLVVRAKHTNGKEYALKISSFVMLEEPVLRDVNRYERFAKREMDLMQRLNHPNIPGFGGIHHFTVNDYLDFDVLATAYVAAPSLEESIEKSTPLGEQQLRAMLHGALSALDYVQAPENGPILHRDIKPSNILFNGETAYVIDFNFSKVDDHGSASTVLQNYGYYPLDTYTGLQTSGQDVCALGNVAIAAAYGKSIEQIRAMQHKKPLEGVDLEELHISRNLKKFLGKLTAGVPLLRYANAHAALLDLAKLDILTAAEMDQRVASRTRAPEVFGLLKILEKEDSLFAYNVPPGIIENYDDAMLMTHIGRTYAQNEFVVEDAREVDNYADVGVMVRCKIAFNGLEILTAGAKGKVEGHDDGKAIVDFGQRKLNCDPQDLKMLKRKGLLTSTPSSGQRFQDTYPDKWKEFDAEYTGAAVYDDQRVPIDTVGMIFGMIKSQYQIVWQNGPGVHQPISKVESTTWSFQSKVCFGTDYLKLVIPNRIDIAKLQKDLDERLSKESKK